MCNRKSSGEKETVRADKKMDVKSCPGPYAVSAVQREKPQPVI